MLLKKQQSAVSLPEPKDDRICDSGGGDEPLPGLCNGGLGWVWTADSGSSFPRGHRTPRRPTKLNSRPTMLNYAELAAEAAIATDAAGLIGL